MAIQTMETFCANRQQTLSWRREGNEIVYALANPIDGTSRDIARFQNDGTDHTQEIRPAVNTCKICNPNRIRTCDFSRLHP